MQDSSCLGEEDGKHCRASEIRKKKLAPEDGSGVGDQSTLRRKGTMAGKSGREMMAMKMRKRVVARKIQCQTGLRTRKEVMLPVI